jgi:hypothetical protein
MHHSRKEYNINKTMRAEIEKLHPNSEVEWESPLAMIIPRTPFAVTYGDSCLQGAGGF